MKWLLTTPADVDLDGVRAEVEAAGGKLEAQKAVPLGENEQVLYAEGPEDLEARLKAAPIPIQVSPNSELELY
ncbi:MAG TPA: hypothetical protein VEW07_10410 [Solirubrobacterales bacterium]|nr:hypothetical protein [Solirubrobacterales bacterium]